MLMLSPENRGAVLAGTTCLHLVRHGAHNDVGRRLSGRADAGGLTLTGNAQATRAAMALGSLDAVHASPRRRTLETASVIAAQHGLPVEEADALDEIDFGAWNGASFDALADDPVWCAWNSNRATAPTPGGETMVQAVRRAVAHLEALVRKGAGRQSHLACVTHCDIIRGVVAHYMGLSLDNILCFDVDPGSITTLRFAPGETRVTRINMVPA